MEASEAPQDVDREQGPLGGHPGSALATGLPPVARTYRPKVVRATMTATTSARARAMSTTYGDAEESPDAEVGERGVEDLGQLAAGDDEGDATARHEQPSVATMGWMPNEGHEDCR